MWIFIKQKKNSNKSKKLINILIHESSEDIVQVSPSAAWHDGVGLRRGHRLCVEWLLSQTRAAQPIG